MYAERRVMRYHIGSIYVVLPSTCSGVSPDVYCLLRHDNAVALAGTVT